MNRRLPQTPNLKHGCEGVRWFMPGSLSPVTALQEVLAAVTSMVLLHLPLQTTVLPPIMAWPTCMLSPVQLCATPWTVACQAPLFMGFPRQEYWSGLPCPPPGDLSNPGIELMSLMSPTLADRFFTTDATWEAHLFLY